VIRRAGAADRDAILALRARCFGDVDPEKRDPRFWDWEFSKAKLFVDDAVSTHIALVPLQYDIGGRVIDGAIAVDAMTAPEARGRGLFGRAVGAAVEGEPLVTAYEIRGGALGSMLRGGFVIAERVPVLVRPFLSIHTSPRGARVGKPAPHEMAEIAAAMPGPRVHRSADFLRWRFFENPHWKYDVAANDDAYIVTRRTTLKGHDTLAIADLAWRDVRAARALVRDAVARAHDLRCRFAAAFVSLGHPAFPLLLRHGFLPGPHWFKLLVRPGTAARERWRVMWADTDHL